MKWVSWARPSERRSSFSSVCADESLSPFLRSHVLSLMPQTSSREISVTNRISQSVIHYSHSQLARLISWASAKCRRSERGGEAVENYCYYSIFIFYFFPHWVHLRFIWMCLSLTLWGLQKNYRKILWSNKNWLYCMYQVAIKCIC